ncbi:hypothetical protein CMV00_01920 [Elizabethkingia anophelis]|nr:hypothetical protein [Elizabethkingia anophelis]
MENLSTIQKQDSAIPENIIYNSKIHWMSYCTSVIQIFFGFIGLLSFAIGIFRTISLLLIILLYKGVIKILRLRYTKVYITKKYLTITTGVINRTTVDLALYRVEGTKIHQGFLGRIFNYGKVYVSTGEITKSFVIENPKEFKDSLSLYSRY